MKRMQVARLCRAGWAISLVVGIQGCAATMRRPPSRVDSLRAVERLDAVVEEYWGLLQVSRPELTMKASGVVSMLPDPTQDRAKQDAQFARAALVGLDEILVDALTEDAYVTWLSMRWEMEAMAGWTAFHWSRIFDLSPGSSVFDRAISILKAQSIRDADAAQRFAGLVASVSDLARDVQREYAERARRDIRLPRPLATRAILHVRELIAPADSSPFGLPRSFRPSLDTAWQSQLVRALETLIVQKVNPALDSLATFLDQERQRASDTLGLSRLPGGAAHYATLLRYRTTLDVTPEEAHAIGLREVARIAALAAAARREAGLPVNRDSLRAVLRRDSSFAFDERRSIAERAAQLFENAVKDFDSLFRPVPNVALSIAVMPAESRLSSPLARYEAPTLVRPSARYLINDEQLEARSALVLPGLVLGDLMPGLHLQQATQFENAASPTAITVLSPIGFHARRPALRAIRIMMNHDGFVRGWQSYALDVADSLSKTLTPWQRFGVRLRQLGAACGLVVDTGINTLGWTRTDALAFLRSYLPDDDADLEREFIFQATESPGTLSAATLGAREFRGLRRWAMRELGDRFSLAAFHNEVLRIGSVPLPVLGSHLERWIWEQNRAVVPPPGGTRR